MSQEGAAFPSCPPCMMILIGMGAVVKVFSLDIAAQRIFHKSNNVEIDEA
jgi:hypothetical protein